MLSSSDETNLKEDGKSDYDTGRSTNQSGPNYYQLDGLEGQSEHLVMEVNSDKSDGKGNPTSLGMMNRVCQRHGIVMDRRSCFKLMLVMLVACVIMVSYHLQHFVSHEKTSDAQSRHGHGHEPLLENNSTPTPLSELSPQDLDLYLYTRPESRPGAFFGPHLENGALSTGIPLPTNSWYQNMLLGDSGSPSGNNRVYTIPFIIDVVGPVAGVRVHMPHIDIRGSVVQMSFVSWFGLTLGWSGMDKNYIVLDGVEEPTFSPLGLHLKWGEKDASMISPIIRGMPYVTMKYASAKKNSPMIAAETKLGSLPVIDDTTQLKCDGSASAKVQEHVQLFFVEPDFTWIIFFSRPVNVACSEGGISPFQLRVVEEEDEPLIVRAALLNNCTKGHNPLYCYRGRPRDQSLYKDFLQKHANLYPYDTEVKIVYPKEDDEESKNSLVKFDWGVESMRDKRASDGDDELIMFALPHHIDIIQPIPQRSSNKPTKFCTESLNGPVCVIKGNEWAMMEVSEPLNFTAPRVPDQSAIPYLAQALEEDIHFSLPDYYMRGVGDTYFSGKMLAKLGRIIVIAQELKDLASKTIDGNVSPGDKLTIEACQNADLPSQQELDEALNRLTAGIEIWLNGTAESKYLYDTMWGGLINCGCWFNGSEKKCDNVFPNCPTFADPGLDFGNGFYNDHHFHYGYHIYAAAIASQFDPQWGRENFEKILLYIRDIANPSRKDKFFPTFRHKDWFLGNSWASGIATLGGEPYMNGRNQESSSESIAAYEAIGLFGSVMVKAWDNDSKYHKIATHVSNLGQLLTATELRSADRYWHVYNDVNRVYPKQYKPNVVGIMWNTMVQFQTWFGNAPFLAYGIQLLPITVVSERRDSVEWCKELYWEFSKSCESNPGCEEQGWSVLQYAVLATVGHKQLALNKTLDLPSEVFSSAGGNGHSLTNTLWYISTRPEVEPLSLTTDPSKLNCKCPDSCTQSALDADANGYTCEQRINWLVDHERMSQEEACNQIGDIEFPDQCGACGPDRCEPSSSSAQSPAPKDGNCPPCSKEVCRGKLNRCQVLSTPYLCFDGPNRGGCSMTPWVVDDVNSGGCLQCCKLSLHCGD